MAKWQRGGLQNRYTRVRLPPAPPPTMKAILKPFLLFLALLLLTAGGFFVWKNLQSLPRKATLTVETPSAVAAVSLDDRSLGNTPLSLADMGEGEFILKLESDQTSFQTKIKLLGGTETAVKREFAPADVFSGGDVLWFERTGGAPSLSVTAEPDSVKIKVDGLPVGETPLLVDDLDAGEHELRLEKEGFETRILKIRVDQGYQLRVSSKLALQPISDSPSVLESGDEKVIIYRLASEKALTYVDQASLAVGLSYWIRTRNLGEKLKDVSYLLDGQGVVYDLEGNTVDLGELVVEESSRQEKLAVGYVEVEGDGLSDKARLSLNALATKILKTPPLVDKVEILPTGTGWLRVRSDPSLSASEVAKVNVGEKFILLEEGEGWAKIKLSDGGEGWVSADFVKKIQEAP